MQLARSLIINTNFTRVASDDDRAEATEALRTNAPRTVLGDALSAVRVAPRIKGKKCISFLVSQHLDMADRKMSGGRFHLYHTHCTLAG